MEYLSKSISETESIAAEIARSLRGGECIALHGQMGAGKTQFVRGLVGALGGNTRAVSSPTYVLLNVYEGGRLAVFHLDAYRVSGPADFEGIGFPELLEQGGIVVVEWADRVMDLIPPKRVEIWIEAVGKMRRKIRVEGSTVDVEG